MLKDNLYTLSDIIFEYGNLKTFVKLNPSHPIFEGHFPGNPILPGASIVQIIKDVLEAYLNRPLRLTKAQDIKFLSPIIPNQEKPIQLQLKLNIQNEEVNIIGALWNDESLFVKFKGGFIYFNSKI